MYVCLQTQNGLNSNRINKVFFIFDQMFAIFEDLSNFFSIFEAETNCIAEHNMGQVGIFRITISTMKSIIIIVLYLLII